MTLSREFYIPKNAKEINIRDKNDPKPIGSLNLISSANKRSTLPMPWVNKIVEKETLKTSFPKSE